MGYATKEVSLGGDLKALIRRPCFAVWAEYEDLVFDRYDRKSETDRERMVRLQEEKERGPLPKAEDSGTIRKKLSREQTKEILVFVQDTFLPDSLVALIDGDQVKRFIDEAGAKLPPPVDLRDLGPYRIWELVSHVGDFIHEAREFSFRPKPEAGDGAKAPSASPGEAVPVA